MERSVRISEEAGQALTRLGARVCAGPDDPEAWAVDVLRGALARLARVPKSSAPSAAHKFFGADGPAKGVRNSALARSRKSSKAEKRDETATIREACLQRAMSYCECGCGRPLATGIEAIPELDHFFGRGKVKQSVETCWILRADCHRDKTNSRPDAASWLRKFIVHCIKQFQRSVANGTAADTNYTAAADRAQDRLRFVEVRASLPAAPKVG